MSGRLAVVGKISYQSNFAMSHIAGCLGSKVIVATNEDKEANLIARLKELKSK